MVPGTWEKENDLWSQDTTREWQQFPETRKPYV